LKNYEGSPIQNQPRYEFLQGATNSLNNHLIKYPKL
jgi:hypothetical protein